MQFKLAVNLICSPTGLELIAVLVPQSPNCWHYRSVPPCTAEVIAGEPVAAAMESRSVGGIFRVPRAKQHLRLGTAKQ